MQDPASFNLEAVKKKIDAMIKQHEGEYRDVRTSAPHRRGDRFFLHPRMILHDERQMGGA